ncbi:Xylose isomerase domain-containing protein TIM barrel [Natronococcus jeotgali DSM 18795]|uniref:Xylose isomerase domain-containing protein TIM barrel n=1 Tax=Natronococcus jeotgali DSM 18795 TaxID=1227498 RepID=L9XXH2_9EURY|nr:Xylose isomerase domain-containing protein TIM barrel [Natronococcus jeotgali DSM 18795]
MDDGVERFLSRYGGLVSHHVHDARSRGDTHLPLGAVEVVTDAVALLSDTAERIRDWLGGPEPTESER